MGGSGKVTFSTDRTSVSCATWQFLALLGPPAYLICESNVRIASDSEVAPRSARTVIPPSGIARADAT
jgi:hypothetical protein